MRTAADIRAQQLAYNQSNLESAVSGLPPSYVEGFKHTLDYNYRVTIGAGLTTVQGTRVEITEDTLLRDVDWLCSKAVDGGSFYYVYISRTRVLYVDRTAPSYSGKYFYFQHPTFGYRAIGKLWLDGTSSQIVWCSSQFTAYTNQVTIAQTGYLGYADYYISETEDASILIQAANDYLYRAFNGGTINLLRGSYTISNIITMSANISLSGSETPVIYAEIPSSAYSGKGGIYVNSYNSKIENIKIENNPTEYEDKALIYYGNLANGCTLSGATVIVNNCNGVRISEGTAITITNNKFSIGGDGLGMYCIYSDGNESIILSNIINIISGMSAIFGILLEDSNYTIISNNQINGTSTSDGLSAGIDVESTPYYTTIASNTVKNCKLYGITNGGTNTQLLGNMCVDNGVDTGIENEDQDNYYDTGTGTYALLNSWQQPVDAEPSVGTLHRKSPLDTGWFYTNTTPSAATWYAVDFSTVTAIGVKAVIAQVMFIDGTGAGGRIYWNITNGDPGPSEQFCIIHQNGLTRGGGQCILLLNSDRKGYIACETTAQDIYVSYPAGYYL